MPGSKQTKLAPEWLIPGVSDRIRALLQHGINKSIIRAQVSWTAARTRAARSPLIVLFMYGADRAAPRPRKNERSWAKG